jgi:L-ribulose-5-phosphate 3-epimerase
VASERAECDSLGMEAKRRLGVCSWSLQPGSAGELVERVRATGLTAVQLALDPLRTGAWPVAETVAALRAAGIEILSGMMGTVGEDYSTLATIRITGGLRPDAHWEENRRAASANARLAHELGLGLVTLHAGFLPEEPGAERTKLVARLREVVDRFAEHGVRAAFETGQEHAPTLLAFLADLGRPTAGVNFDPANMLLYDMDEPTAALAELAPWVRQIHVKDARRTRKSGTWGEEVAVGSGEVDWGRFFDVVAARKLAVDLLIEREAGAERIEDIRTARARVERELVARRLA